MLRFAPEMNGNWDPWDEGTNGNTSGQYVQAWRHVHDLFVADGAADVQWVWSPNTDYSGSTPLIELYPGNAYVDYIGIDGYNWGTSQSWSAWQTPEQVFNPTIADIRSFTHERILLTEVSSAEEGGSKARWITRFFAWLEATPAVIGFVWFEFRKEADWLVQSSSASKAAFVAGLATY
jgi:Glycosyl hydrolase family 26